MSEYESRFDRVVLEEWAHDGECVELVTGGDRREGESAPLARWFHTFVVDRNDPMMRARVAVLGQSLLALTLAHPHLPPSMADGARKALLVEVEKLRDESGRSPLWVPPEKAFEASNRKLAAKWLAARGITNSSWAPGVGRAPEPGQTEAGTIREPDGGAVGAPRDGAPIPMRLVCPSCCELHVDEGQWATRPHHTHACQECGEVWRPAVVNTVGVKFLPGFRNGSRP